MRFTRTDERNTCSSAGRSALSHSDHDLSRRSLAHEGAGAQIRRPSFDGAPGSPARLFHMEIVNALRIQALACDELGSDLYARLLRLAAEKPASGRPVRAVVGDWSGDPVDDALALQLMGAVHRLVLTGAADHLAVHYPSVGGAPRWPECGAAFLETLAVHRERLCTDLTTAPQTNEAGRAAVLLGGLLEVVRIFDLPVRLLEIGASAGLNLLVDRYRFDLGVGTWGDPASPLLIRSRWTGEIPDLGAPLEIRSRRGCDLQPLDAASADDRVTLRSFVWADQVERLERLDGALEIAAPAPPDIDIADARHWLPGQLADPTPGVVTVVQHSVVMPYLSQKARHKVMTSIRAAGEAATVDAPLAWLRYEPAPRTFELRLALWPQGVDLLLAEAHAHGHWADWHAGGASV